MVGLALAFSVLALGRFGWTPRGCGLLPLLLALALATILDLRARLVPDVVTLPALGYALLRAATLEGAPTLVQAALGTVVAGGVVLLLAVVSRGGIGGGDIKLTALLGAALGWQGALIAFALSQLAGGLIALILIAVLRRRPARHLPVGALIALLGALLLLGAP